MTQNGIKKNTIYSAIKSLASIVFPLITFPYITRILQPENIGKVNFSNSVVSYFSLIANLGISTYAIRECAKVKDDKEQLQIVSSEILSINLITTIIAYFFLIIAICTVQKLRDYKLLILIQSVTIICATIGADWLNTAMEDFKYVTIRTMLFQLVSFICMILFVKKAAHYINYAIILVMSTSGASIINVFYRRRYCKTSVTTNLNLKKHLPSIFNLFAVLLAQQVFTMSDTTIIGFCLGDYSVGLYTTALKLYNIVTSLLASITWVVMPQLTIAISKEEQGKIEDIFKFALQFIFVLGLPCVAGLFMLNKEIMLMVGGTAYLAADRVLRILSVTLLATFFSNFFLNIYMLSMGKDSICLLACSVAAIFNIIGNLIFIPNFGIEAAAVTTLVAQIIISIICILFWDKRIRIIPLFNFLWQPFLAVLILICVIICSMSLFEWYWISFLNSVVIGGIAYIGVLYILKNQFIIDIFVKLKKK